MVKHLFILASILTIFLLSTTNSVAQERNNYIDHKPVYRKWLESYILDKIEYKPTATIFYFRFVSDNTSSGGATFYPPGGEFPWYLKGRGISKEYDITAVKNIRRNGVLVKDNVVGEEFHTSPAGSTGYTIFSCEVHFPKLDGAMKEADLIEGKGQDFNQRHFNCFNIKLKTWEEDLGTDSDSKNIVSEFENKYSDNPTKTTPKPKKETSPKVIETKEEYAPSNKTFRSAKDLVCNEILILDNIKFHDNTANFKGMIEADRTLAIILNYMKKEPETTLRIYGHSDVFGDEERNLNLSKQRAIKIQRWLSMYGIKGHRIDYEWFGSKNPLVAEGDPSNRRVEIKLNCN